MKTLKYKHLYGEAQREKFEQVQPSSITCDSTMIKPNSKYTAFLWNAAGGGIVCVVDSKNPCKLPPGLPMIKGHQGSILDLDWYPFDDQYLATSSIDTTIKIWRVPEQFNADLTEAESTLYGHDKKVNTIQFHPSASFVVASGSYDSTIKVWDVQRGEAQLTIQAAAQAPTVIDWNYDGSLIGSSWNDKRYRVADPRANKFVVEQEAHQGTKPQRFAWLGSTGYYVTVGFSKDHQREYALWNINKPDTPVETKVIDNQSGVLLPTWDDGLGMLYLVGKGDSNIKYWEFQDGQLHFINAYAGKTPGKGYGFFPKRALDVSKCEVMKVAKIEDKAVEFISFYAPRKSTNFQEDLYPVAPSGEPALTSEQWFAGQTAGPKLHTLKPDSSPVKVQNASVKFEQKDKPQKLSPEEELVHLRQRVAELEKETVEKDLRIQELEEELNGHKQK